MTKPGSNVFKRHMKELQTGFYGKGFISGLIKAMHSNDRKRDGYSVSQTASKMSDDETDQLIRLIERDQPKIRPEHEKQGLKTLQYYKRDTSDFLEFRLIGFYDCGYQMPHYIPIFEYRGKNGSYRYTIQSWQSGGNGLELF